MERVDVIKDARSKLSQLLEPSIEVYQYIWGTLMFFAVTGVYNTIGSNVSWIFRVYAVLNVAGLIVLFILRSSNKITRSVNLSIGLYLMASRLLLSGPLSTAASQDQFFSQMYIAFALSFALLTIASVVTSTRQTIFANLVFIGMVSLYIFGLGNEYIQDRFFFYAVGVGLVTFFAIQFRRYLSRLVILLEAQESNVKDIRAEVAAAGARLQQEETNG
jgi:hypothetical protein